MSMWYDSEKDVVFVRESYKDWMIAIPFDTFDKDVRTIYKLRDEIQRNPESKKAHRESVRMFRQANISRKGEDDRYE